MLNFNKERHLWDSYESKAYAIFYFRKSYFTQNKYFVKIRNVSCAKCTIFLTNATKVPSSSQRDGLQPITPSHTYSSKRIHVSYSCMHECSISLPLQYQCFSFSFCCFLLYWDLNLPQVDTCSLEFIIFPD